MKQHIAPEQSVNTSISRRRWITRTLPLLATPLAACGGGWFDEAAVRFVNGSSDYTSVDAYARGRKVCSNLEGRGEVSDYATVEAEGSIGLTFTQAGKSDSLADTSISLDNDERVTAVLVGTLAQRTILTIRETNGESASGKARLRVLHAAADAGALDVYVTASNQVLSEVQPTWSVSSTGQLTAFVTEDARNRRIRITRAGDKNVLLFDASEVELASRDTATLAVVSAQRGSLLALGYLPELRPGRRVANALS